MGASMKTIQINGWIWAKPSYDGRSVEYSFDDFDFEAAAKRGTASFGEYRKVCEHTVTAEVPNDFDPRQMRINQLEAERTELRAKFQMRLTEIQEEISKLNALPFSGEDIGDF